jgi:tetratricopeptide (TPR) repeat protein
VERDPAFRLAWDTLGFAHLKAGRYGQAIPALLKAVELEPNYPDAWRHLLHAYDRSGQAEKLAGAKAWVAGILPDEVARFEKEQGTVLAD